MSPEGWAENARRWPALVFVGAGLASFGRTGIWIGIGLIVLGIGIYIAFPAPKSEKDALRYARGPAVIGPDLLGLALTGLFFALPFWVALGEARYGEAAALVHGAAWLVWPMAAVTASLLVVGIKYASFRLVIEADGLRLTTARARRFIPYDGIVSVAPWKRGLPRFVRGLVPLLLMMGNPGSAGAIILARDTTGFELKLTDGKPVRITADGFEKNTKRLLKVLRGRGVSFEAGLSKWLR